MSDRSPSLLFGAILATTEVGAESMVYEIADPEFPFGCHTQLSLPRQAASLHARLDAAVPAGGCGLVITATSGPLMAGYHSMRRNSYPRVAIG